MTDYLENPRCGDSNSSFSLEFSSDMNQMEGGLFGSKTKHNTHNTHHSIRSDLIKHYINIISDPEGFDLMKQGEYNPTVKTTKLYVCGDILDSTGDISTPERLAAKSYNLNNIRNCLIHDNIHLIFGNRDLNKIKCKYLCVLNGDTPHIKNFNGGDIILDAATYHELCIELHEQTDKTAIWKAKMNNWYPFWGGIKKDKGGLNDKGQTNQKDWSIDTKYDTNIFLTRFYEIFGPDTTAGTMSAQNLLETIFKEINITKITLNGDSLKDYKAFLVLAIFRSMCIKSNFKETEIDKITNSSQVKGWLIKLYEKGKIVDYVEDKINLYVMSHGGITKNLVKGEEHLSKMKNTLKSKSTDEIKNILTDASKFYGNVQAGGYIKTDVSDSDLIKCDELKIKLNAMQQSIKNSIDEINKKDYIDKPDADMLYLFILTSGFDCNSFMKKYMPNGTQNTNCTDIVSSEKYGPVMPGIYNMRDLMFLCTDKTLYQFIGHKPVGFGAIIDKFTTGDKTHKGFLITLDNSNSFNNTLKNFGFSMTMVQIDEKVPDINIHTKMDLKIDIFGPQNPKTVYRPTTYNEKYKWTQIVEKDQIIYSKDFKLTNKITIANKLSNIESDIDKTNGINEKTTVCYHGYFVQSTSKKKFHVLTHQANEAWDKNLLILDDADFNNFVEHNVSVAHTTPTTHTGGYQQKYLKYKQKYLQLKQMLEQQQ